MISLLDLPFISIEEICNGDVLEDFTEWYDVWSPRFLWQKSNDPARVQTLQLSTSVQTHIDELKEHIKNLENEKKVLERLPPAYLDIKINRINSEANKLINKGVPNKYEDSKIQEEAGAQFGPNIPALINHFNSFPVGTELIGLTSTSFKDDWDNKQEPKDLITHKLEELAEPLRKTLRDILRIHTQPVDEEYKLISDENRPSIQSFWDGFKFLLGDLPQINSIIRDSLISTGKAPVPVQTFFNPEFFNKLREDPHDFKPELDRDQFLTLDQPRTLLTDIRAVAKPLFFSSDFPKEFTADPKYLDPEYVSPPSSDPVQEAKAKKNAKLHKLLYLVYLLARLDNTIPHNTPINNQDILRNLYDWVKDNNDFDDTPQQESEPVSLPELLLQVPKKSPLNKPHSPSQMHALIAPPVFRKHYLELLTLICSKIQGCDMPKKVSDPILLHKVGEFGNFDDIRPHNPESVIPEDTIKALKDNLVSHNVEMVNNAIDQVLDDLSNIDITDDEDEEVKPDIDDEDYSNKQPEELLQDALKTEEEQPVITEEPIVVVKGKPQPKVPTKGKKEPVPKDKPSKYQPSTGQPEEEQGIGKIKPVTEVEEEKDKKIKPTKAILPSEKKVRGPKRPFVPTEEEEEELPRIVLHDNPIVKAITSPTISPQKKLSPTIGDINKSHLRPKEIPKKQKDSIEKVLNRFIPTNGDLDPPAKKFVEKMDDKANAAETPEKKAALKNILINFLITRQLTKDPKVISQIAEISNVINAREVDRLVNPISETGSAGLRNFFMMTLNPTMNLRYVPQTNAEAHFYRHDLLFFVALYGHRTIQELARKMKGNKDLNKHLEPYTREMKIALGYLRNKKIDDREMLSVLKEEKTDLLSKNVKLSRFMPAYDFFKTQFDFFDYFKVEDKEGAEFSHYRRVYLNFYTFLVSLRKIIKHEIPRPHEFVLANLHICMLYTAGVNDVDLESSSSVCLLSHRKYAEMYYFYKLYLLATNRPGVSDLSPAPGFTFDSNVNVFLNFVLQSPLYQSAFNNACKDSNAPVCQSSTFFRALISYFRKGELALDKERMQSVFRTPNFGTNGYFFNVLNALDAARLNFINGNVIDYSKSIGLRNDLLQSIGLIFDNFDDHFHNALALYLKRSYKRLSFTPAEKETNSLTKAILSSESSDLSSQDSFLQVISLNNEFMPENLSFFLQLATTTDEFKRLAKFIIDTHSFDKLLDMKDESHFIKYRDLVTKIYEFKEKLSTEKSPEDVNKQLINYIRDFMHARIKESGSLCYLNLRGEFHNQVLAVEEYDLAEALLGELEEEETQREVSADDQWNSGLVNDVAKKVENSPRIHTIEQVVTIEVPEDQLSAIHMDLGLGGNNIQATVVGDDGFEINNLADIDPSRIGGVMLNGQKLAPLEFQSIAQRIERLKADFANKKGDSDEEEGTTLV